MATSKQIAFSCFVHDWFGETPCQQCEEAAPAERMVRAIQRMLSYLPPSLDKTRLAWTVSRTEFQDMYAWLQRQSYTFAPGEEAQDVKICGIRLVVLGESDGDSPT